MPDSDFVRYQLLDRLRELPLRLGPRHRVPQLTWPVPPATRTRIKLVWPKRLEWALAGDILESLQIALMDLGVVTVGDVPQPFDQVILLECIIDGRKHTVALDYSDYHDRIKREALAVSALYFKMQYWSQGYDDRRIVPGGYIATGADYYRYLHAYRRAAQPKTIDIVGRFGLTFQREYRTRAVDALSEAKELNFVGQGPKVRYSRFLREVASARLALHLPGNGPFTHRVIEFLGLGTCMVSPPFLTQLNVPLVPGEHFVQVREDLSDLAEVCRAILAKPDELNRIARAGQDLFDRYCHCDQLASYLLTTMVERLPKS